MRVIEKLVKIAKVHSVLSPRVFLVFLAFLHLQISNYFIPTISRTRFLEFPIIA